MSATICGYQLTPTHDGETALVIELAFYGGGRSKVHLNAVDMATVLHRAGLGCADDIIGHSWSILQVRDAPFTGAVDRSNP
jgi:hypothetical protein